MLKKIKSFFSGKNIREKYERYEKYISPVALIAGFILDSLTLRRPDLLAENILIIVYFIIAACGICILNVRRENNLEENKLHFWSLMAVQFVFGGLFSTFLVFYIRSSSFSASWLFLLFLGGNFLATEFFKSKYRLLSIQVSVLFISLFSYAIIFIPTIFHKLNAWMFLLSGLTSLALIYLFMLFFFFVTKGKFEEKKKIFVRNILGIFAFINILYFTNVIPPVPLLLKDAGVYHSVSLTSGGYRVYYEKKNFFDYFRIWPVYHSRGEEGAYVYSAVFSPTDLNINIIHNWQYFDSAKTRWVSVSKVNLSLYGGRDDGYRLYSFNTKIFPGLWRVDVETPGGQVIGRVKFKVKEAEGEIKILEDIK